MFDSHCHLYFPEFENTLSQTLLNCKQNDIHQWMLPGINLDSLSKFQVLIEKSNNSTIFTSNFDISKSLYFSLGLHPYFIEQHTLNDIKVIDAQIQSFDISAIGETGLDSTRSNHSLQKALLIKHFELAQEYELPIILHHRNTQNELLEVAKQFPKVKGVIHAFSGSFEQAKQWTDKGFFLGIGGTITYERAKKTIKAISKIDTRHLLIETDAPSMPIFGSQGKVNNPVNLREIAKNLAEIKKIHLSELDDQTTKNAQNLFRKI